MKEKSLSYLVLDVFSAHRYKGNPLAVVFTEGNLQTVQYQNIAREFGYSETSFVYCAEAFGALDVRSFTPTGVDVGAGAGHNLLGAVCGALLKGMKIFDSQEEAGRFVMMKGVRIPVSVSMDATDQHPVVQMQQRTAVIGRPVPADKLAPALGLEKSALSIRNLIPTVVQTEVAHTMVPVKNISLLNDIVPDDKLLIEISKEYGFEGFYCFAFPEKPQDHLVEARFFNPLIGIDEDAATGTAAGPLTGFLAENKYIQADKEYKILQGVKLNQPSLMDVTAKRNHILVGGRSIVTMRGEIDL